MPLYARVSFSKPCAEKEYLWTYSWLDQCEQEYAQWYNDSGDMAIWNMVPFFIDLVCSLVRSIHWEHGDKLILMAAVGSTDTLLDAI